jgi:hypothetical protein
MRKIIEKQETVKRISGQGTVLDVNGVVTYDGDNKVIKLEALLYMKTGEYIGAFSIGANSDPTKVEEFSFNISSSAFLIDATTIMNEYLEMVSTSNPIQTT